MSVILLKYLLQPFDTVKTFLSSKSRQQAGGLYLAHPCSRAQGSPAKGHKLFMTLHMQIADFLAHQP
jgi:hypothetical protein